jgi:hypothetical protein
MPSAAGTWCFRGSYSGDTNYSPSYDGSAAECFGVGQIFEDSSPSVTYDGWHSISDPSASGGAYRTAANAGATASFGFSGTGITWITRKGPDQGIAFVTIDGTNKSKIDLYATSAQSFSRSFSGLGPKPHTIVVTVTGHKNAASSGSNVAIDAFIVGVTTIEDSSSSVTYDSWTGASSTSASGGTYRLSQKAGSTISLTFTGTRVDWLTATGPSAGMATVTIDGVSMGTVDLYAPSVNWQVPESYRGLASGSHTIVVSVLGTKDAAATSALIVVDAFVVYSYP